MSNPYIAKLEREKLERDIREFFAQGNELKVIGHQMRSTPPKLVINPKKGYVDKVDRYGKT